MANNVFETEECCGSDFESDFVLTRILKTIEVGIDEVTSIATLNDMEGDSVSIVSIYGSYLPGVLLQSNGTQYAAEIKSGLSPECYTMYGTGKTVYCVNDKNNFCFQLKPRLRIEESLKQLNFDVMKSYTFENYLIATSVCCLEKEQIAVCFVNDNSYNPSRSFVRVCTETAAFQGRRYDIPTLSGRPQKDIEFYQHERLFRYPRRIAQNSNEDLWVVNRLNENTGNIVVIDLEGKLKFRYNRNTDNLSFDPMDVAANKNGSMIIADFGNHLIHLVKDDGTFLQYIMTRKHGLAFPSTIALDQSDRAWIGCDFGKVHIVRFNKRFK